MTYYTDSNQIEELMKQIADSGGETPRCVGDVVRCDGISF